MSLHSVRWLIIQWAQVQAADVPGLISHHNELPSWPALVFLYRGRFMAMEIKRPGKKLSTEQRALHIRIADAGFMACVVESLDQATKELAMFLKAARDATPHWGAAA